MILVSNFFASFLIKQSLPAIHIRGEMDFGLYTKRMSLQN